MREALDVDVPLKSLFATPTIAGLAATLDQLRIERADDASVEAALQELESLTEDEVSALIEQL